MNYTCCLCGYYFDTLPQLFQHNSTHHKNQLASSRYSITSCIKCSFAYSNPSITKLHTELSHQPGRNVLFTTHHRFVNRLKAIEEFRKVKDFELNSDLILTIAKLKLSFRK